MRPVIQLNESGIQCLLSAVHSEKCRLQCLELPYMGRANWQWATYSTCIFLLKVYTLFHRISYYFCLCFAPQSNYQFPVQRHLNLPKVWYPFSPRFALVSPNLSCLTGRYVLSVRRPLSSRHSWSFVSQLQPRLGFAHVLFTPHAHSLLPGLAPPQ